MKSYQAVRIIRNGMPTYGDTYARIRTEKELAYNEVVQVGNDKYIILFEEEK